MSTSWFAQPLRALNDADVEYVVVGGVAVNALGHLRTTQDVDLVVGLEPNNARRAVAALGGIGYTPRVPVPAEAFADAAQRRRWMEEKHMLVFSLVHAQPAWPIVDLFVDYPLPWDELFAASGPREVAGVTARVCSLDHLIRIKQQAGRPRDIEDVRNLRIANDLPEPSP